MTLPQNVPDDRRDHERRESSMYELLIRVDERVTAIMNRLDAREKALNEMQTTIEANTERSLANEHTVDRHESLLNWLLRLVMGVVVVAILAAAGLSAGAF